MALAVLVVILCALLSEVCDPAEIRQERFEFFSLVIVLNRVKTVVVERHSE